MDPDNPANVELVLQNNMFNTNTLSWAPDGTRLVLGKMEGEYRRPSDLYIYNLQSESLEKIVQTTGISWMTAWSPKGDWIAFTDDTRSGGSKDELMLINPDTGEIIKYGDKVQDEFCGWYPS